LFNRTYGRAQQVVADQGSEGSFLPAETIEEFVAALERPRRIVIMVKAGKGTDATIDTLLPHLEEGDIVVDGGNAYFEDTRRREARLRELDLHFVGAGISGGEVGALEDPSIMPGGSRESYDALGPILEDISAHVGDEPCCTYIGTDGAGHFVKMVHNGIEYADMQFIGEAYELLKAAGLDNHEMADVFATWNNGDLDSYVIEITSDVLRQIDAKTGRPLVDVILDAAGMKGTGTWTVQCALDLGVPVNAIAEAVFARATSSHRELREHAQTPSTGRTAPLPMLVMLRVSAAGHRRHPRRPLGEQGCRVRPRLGRDPNGQPRVRLGHQRGRGREDLARRVHHPSKASRAHPQRIRRGRSRDPPRSPKRQVPNLHAVRTRGVEWCVVPLQPECQCLVSRRLSPTTTPSGRHESTLLSRRVYAISSVPTWPSKCPSCREVSWPSESLKRGSCQLPRCVPYHGLGPRSYPPAPAQG
jgi:6-phosphogluconate dehydrogenase (decarboxylating)